MMKCMLQTMAFFLIGTLCGIVQAQESDERAVEVLKAMSAYKASFDRLVIRGAFSSDARLEEGLIVSNTEEITIAVDRPGSMHYHSFDGVNSKDLYLNGDLLTLSHSEKGLYAQATTPKGIDEALDFVLDELDIDLPLMDLVKQDSYSSLVDSSDTVIYLTDKSRVHGVNCHQVAIRTPEVDVQIWVQEGGQPLPRRIVITSKWAGGAPRFIANMDWDVEPDIDQSQFDFKPPEGASQIEFIDAPAN